MASTDHTERLKRYLKKDDYTYSEIGGIFQYRNYIDWIQINELTKELKTPLEYLCQSMIYQYGYDDKHQDKDKAEVLKNTAIELIRKSGYKNVSLFTMILHEGIGATLPAKQKFDLLVEAYNHGEVLCLDDIARCYLEGNGVEQNVTKAFDYFEESLLIHHEFPYLLEEIMRYEPEIYMKNRAEKIRKLEAEAVELQALREENKALKEENEILNLLPDAPGYHEAKKRFYEPPKKSSTESTSKK